MEQKFSFNIAQTPHIFFGSGKIAKLPQLILKYGKNVLFVHGKSFIHRTEYQTVTSLFAKNNITWNRVNIDNEPSPELINNTCNAYRNHGINAVCALGGGSVIDAGKAISAMLTVNAPVQQYLEGVGELQPPGSKVPFIAIPTTAGTGSEMTKNAVITQYGGQCFKKSLRHNNYVPNIALIDPDLTYSCPPQVTAASGMDALSQLVEPYLSEKTNHFIDGLCIQGITSILNNIELAVNEPDNELARTNMAYGAMLSGIALANAGLGLVHGFAQPLGSWFKIPHGIVCGTLMALINKTTFEKALALNHTWTINRYASLGKLVNPALTDNKQLAHVFIDKLIELTKNLKLPKLSNYTVNKSDVVNIASQTGHKNHPVKLTQQELENILLNRM